MRKLVIVASLLVLGACNSQKSEPAAPSPAAMASEADAGAADSLVGTYEEKTPQGKTLTTSIKPDGSYTEEVEGKVTESGKWLHKDGKDCFDPEGDAAPTRCFTKGAIGADGTFTATAANGKSITIKKIN